MMYKKIGFLFLIIAIAAKSFSQNTAVIYGNITDNKQNPVELVTISIFGNMQRTITNKKGFYELVVPANKDLLVLYSFIGYKTDSLNIFLKPGERKEYMVLLEKNATTLPDLFVNENRSVDNNLVKIDPLNVNVIPSGVGGVESILKTLPGVSSNNELSSQYNVRGGNYDENLVYVNDVEIYRPFLARSGQQEGLSFINSDLVSGIEFSAGGFDAKYGDKMSSALDIKYKKPTVFAGSVSGSLLGFSTHIEGITKNDRFMYLLGIRQKSNQYLLKSLDTKGSYKPSFTDVQAYLNYKWNHKINIDFLGNFARNIYNVIPQNRETDFGTINDAIRLMIYFDGQEVDRFNTQFGAFSVNYQPQKQWNLKFSTSAYQTNEKETFDTQGAFWLSQIETSMGSNEFDSVAYNLGAGAFLNHARNYLKASVVNTEHKGTHISDKLIHYWGVRYQREYINDQINEWNMIDSADYTLPYNADSIGYINPNIQPYYYLEMQDVIKAKNVITSNRYSGYYQQKWMFDYPNSAISLIAGVRASYWDWNEQYIFSPRATISIKPAWKKDFVFRFSSGIYQQPPFYREIRDFTGVLHKEVKAQKSIHFVLSSQHEFTAWGRPFKYVTEAYYKILKNLIPYEVDNVRIRYYANNSAHGYAAGLDMKVNGEFVKGIESWASLSFMKTMEDIEGDYYYDFFNQSGEKIIPGFTFDQVAVDSTRFEPGYIPRPTDQRVNFALFFQDYLPKNPTYKMHLTLMFGSSLPFGPPEFNKYKDTLRVPSYRRVDIGFSKQLIGEDTKVKPNNPLRFFKSLWLSMEVFNLLQVSNTISYIWIKDYDNRQYAIPNYLTPRQLNVKIIAQF